MSRSNRQILFVDDEQSVLDSLRRTLRPRRNSWEMTFVNHPKTAWRRLRETDFDVAVIDVKMPGLGGLALLERIHQADRTKDLPVLMLTGLSDRRLKRQALDLGATDLLNKPIDSEDLVARLQSALRLKSYQDQLKTHRYLLEEKVHRRTEELAQSRLDMIWRLGKVAEQRDEETGNHVIRVGFICRVIGQAMGMDPEDVGSLFLAAPLHDIGKIGIPDAILLKRGRLNREEWAIMKQHCRIGARILREDSKIRTAFLQWRDQTPGPKKGPGLICSNGPEGASHKLNLVPFSAAGKLHENPFLALAARIALAHHEKWDGTGYPQGLAGEAIPQEARIVAIADVFDALGSKRPYKEPVPENEILRMIAAEVGRHFDPGVYATFMEVLPEIKSIRERFSDTTAAMPRPEEKRDEDLVCR